MTHIFVSCCLLSGHYLLDTGLLDNLHHGFHGSVANVFLLAKVGKHGRVTSDTVLLTQLGTFLMIDLVHLEFGELLGQLLHHGVHLLAEPTPIGVDHDNDGFLGTECFLHLLAVRKLLHVGLLGFLLHLVHVRLHFLLHLFDLFLCIGITLVHGIHYQSLLHLLSVGHAHTSVGPPTVGASPDDGHNDGGNKENENDNHDGKNGTVAITASLVLWGGVGIRYVVVHCVFLLY